MTAYMQKIIEITSDDKQVGIERLMMDCMHVVGEGPAEVML